jgi:hypothetical protein
VGLSASGRIGSCTNAGELLDGINGTRAYRAYLQGVLRGDSIGYITAGSTGTDITGANGGTFYMEGDVADCVSAAVSGEKFVSTGIGGHVTDADDYCRNAMNRLVADMPDSYRIQIYSAPQVGTESLLYQSPAAIASSTVTTLGDTTDLDDIFLQSKDGERLVVRVALMTGTANLNTIDKYELLGKTIVMSNKRLVDEDNF